MAWYRQEMLKMSQRWEQFTPQHIPNCCHTTKKQNRMSCCWGNNHTLLVQVLNSWRRLFPSGLWKKSSEFSRNKLQIQIHYLCTMKEKKEALFVRKKACNAAHPAVGIRWSFQKGYRNRKNGFYGMLQTLHINLESY